VPEERSENRAEYQFAACPVSFRLNSRDHCHRDLMRAEQMLNSKT
jgi:hypothetical protein